MFKKVGFNDAEKFGLIHKEVMLIPDMAQFSFYQGVPTYEDLLKAVKEYDTNRTAYLEA